MRRTAGLATTLFLLLAPGAAGKPFCVNTGGCPAADNRTTVQAGLDAAASNGGPDTVKIGSPESVPPGTAYSYASSSSNPVHIIGLGRVQTTLSNGNGLNITGPGSRVSNLTYAMPGDSSNYAFVLGGGSVVSNVAITGGGSTTGGIFFQSAGTGRVERTLIELPVAGGLAIHAGSGSVTVEDSVLQGGQGINVEATGASVTVRRSSIRVGDTGLNVIGGLVTAEDVSIRHAPGPAGTGALVNAATGSPTAELRANHVTFYGSGGPSSYALQVFMNNPSRASRATLRNSILRNYAHIDRTAYKGEASISLAYSIFAPATIDSYSAPGSGMGEVTLGPGNRTGDPGLDDPANGNFRLRSNSIAVNAGDPTGVAFGESSTDLAGLPRISGGRRDIGAFEFQFPPPARPAQPAEQRARAAFTASSATVGPNGRGSVLMRCRLPASVTCNVGLSLQAAQSQLSAKRRKKPKKVGTVKGKVRGGKSGRVPLKLNKRGKKALRKRRKLKVTAKGTVKAKGATTARVTKKLTLKLKKKRRKRR